MVNGKIKGESKIEMIPVFQISVNPSQPRKQINKKEIISLSKSIELNGVLQPLTVRDVSPFEYELISGERRLRAAVMAGFSFVPCIIIHCSERQAAVYGLLENVQRIDLSYFEQADYIKKLVDDYGLTLEKVSRQIGISEFCAADKLKLSEFTTEERKILSENLIPESYAYILLKVKDSSIRLNIIKKIAENQLSLIDTEELVQSLISPDYEKALRANQKIVIKDIRPFFNTIRKAVSTMKHSGIKAVEEKTETEDFIEYRIRITK
ncbi:MAG: ParB/RepB/Spo0J family partition protein [Clostridia bacterium]|nr:ParB/RepB/Spo0J family partition protein [Clostridia bacterium]